MRTISRFIIGLAVIAWLGLAPARQGYGARSQPGPASILKEFDTTIDLSVDATISDFTSVGDTLFFAGDSAQAGIELWKSVAGGAPAQVKDIAPGPAPSLTENYDYSASCGCIIGVFEGVLYFWANDQVHGYALWRSDGTEAGTFLVSDAVAASQSSVRRPSFTVAGDEFYFAGATAAHGEELWRSDGTAAGTTLVKDIYPGPNPSNIHSLTAMGGAVYFVADDGTSGQEVWRTDGTTAGTIRLTDLTPGGTITWISWLKPVGSRLLFLASDSAHGNELWSSDGTAAGTALVADIRPGPEGSQIWNPLAVLDDVLYFTANDGVRGSELWRSDGTAAGTALVVDLTSGNNYHSGINQIAVMGGRLYFNASVNGDYGDYGLWCSDGTAAGTTLVKATDGYVNNLTLVDDTLYFTTFIQYDTYQDIKVWSSDGTAAGTGPVAAINDRSIGAIQQLIASGGLLYFTGITNQNGYELWVSDGKADGTAVLEMGKQGVGSYVRNMVTMNGLAYFTANASPEGEALWRSDGTAAGTTLIKDIAPADWSSAVSGMTVFSDTLYFSADDGVHGRELWRSDGTTAGTTLVKDIRPGATRSIQTNERFVPAYGALFFAVEGADGAALWRSDGSAAGTVPVATPWPGQPNVELKNLILVNDTLFFSTWDTVNGGLLWRSDGTAAGTVLVKPMPGVAGTFGGNIEGVMALDGTLLFQVYGSELGQRFLWRSDGTANGTVPLSALRVLGWWQHNDAAYFTAAGEFAHQLWRTDGSLAGTSLVMNAGWGFVGATAAVGDLIYFSDSSLGFWRSDGTAAGTAKIRNLNVGSITTINNHLYLSAYNSEFGGELWHSNGTLAGTAPVQDIAPGWLSSFPANFVRLNNQLLFVANDHLHGEELWSLPLAPDTTPPTITTPAPINATTSDPAGMPIAYAVTVSDDYDIAPDLACAPASGSRFPVGATVVTCAASDISGNTASAAFTVTVALSAAPDTTPPTISVPNAVSVETGDPAGAIVQYVATATDTVDPSPSLSCQPPAGSRFPVGATQVTCTASDASGNSASASFTVTVALRQRLYLPLINR